MDELFAKIRGKRHYLWRAVDQDGEKIDILVQKHRNAHAANRFFRKLLKGQGSEPWRLVTDKLRSYAVALWSVMPTVAHDTRRYANNRAEVSFQPTRQRESLMRRWSCARLRRCSLCYATNQLDKCSDYSPDAARSVVQRMECSDGKLSGPFHHSVGFTREPSS